MPDESELIDVAKTFPTLHIDLKYATADNITGRPIYQEALCLLHSDAATALAKAISIAARRAEAGGVRRLPAAAGAGPAGTPARTRSMWLTWQLAPITAAVRPSTSR